MHRCSRNILGGGLCNYVCMCVSVYVRVCDYYFLSSNILCECQYMCVIRWKERCRIFALLNPFSVCDEMKYV